MRRSRIDIIAEILRVTKNGSQKTRLVYETNINFTLLKEYLLLLYEKGFVELFDEKIFATDLGLKFLRAYDNMYDLLRENEIEKSSQAHITKWAK
jgi:predicted transcriptional regulator